MSPLLLQSIKKEYQSTHFSIDEICKRYNINPTTLGDTSTWSKDYSTNIVTLPSNPTSPPSIPDTYNSEGNDKDKEKLSTFKDSIYNSAKIAITKIDAMLTEEDLEPKDIKALSDTLLSLKDAVIGKDPTLKIDITQNNNTIVQLVRDVVKGYRDDC